MLSLRDLMTTEIISVRPDTPLAEVAELLAVEGISGVPVVGTNRVLGVISASDIMDFSATDVGETRELGAGPVWDSIEAERDEPVLAPFFYDPWLDGHVASDAEDWNEDKAAFGEFTAADVMTRSICALPSSARIDDAGRYMIERGIHRVLVIDDGALVGIVTSMDFVRAVAEHSGAAV
jgi:CBS domain-containing protein